jgi:hypothetical protein
VFVVIDGLLTPGRQTNYLGSDLDLALYWGILIGAAAAGVVVYSRELDRKEKQRQNQLRDARRAYQDAVAKRRPNDGEFGEFVSDCWPFFGLGLYG